MSEEVKSPIQILRSPLTLGTMFLPSPVYFGTETYPSGQVRHFVKHTTYGTHYGESKEEAIQALIDYNWGHNDSYYSG